MPHNGIVKRYGFQGHGQLRLDAKMATLPCWCGIFSRVKVKGDVMSSIANQCGASVNNRSKLMRSVARRPKKLQRVIHRIRFNTQFGISDLREPVELRSRAEQSTVL